MNVLLKVIRDELQKIIDNIDAGNSNASEEEALSTIKALKQFTDKEIALTKYQSAEYLHVSRATFDNLIRDGKLPKGEKLYAGDSNIFWYKKDLDKYKLELTK